MLAVDPVMYRTWARETAGILRPDLRSWALQVMLSGLPFEARMAERNRALKAAAEFLPEGLSSVERARQLHAELAALRRTTRPAHPDMDSLRGCLALALLARDRVPTQRQIWNALRGSV